MARGGFIHIDDHELAVLEVDISEAPGRMQRNATETTRKGAKIIDREMTVDASGHMGNWFGVRATAYGIDLEKHVSHEMLSPLEAEIGIEYKGSGKLAHIIAKGSIHNGPAYDYMAGPRRALPRVVEAYADAAERSVLGGDGAE